MGLGKKLGVLGEPEEIDDPSGEVSALEEFILGLIVVPVHGIDGEDLLEIDNLGVLLVDLDGCGTPVDGPHGEGSHGRRYDHDEEEGDNRPLPLSDDPPVVPEVDLALLLGKGLVIPWRRELIILIHSGLSHIISLCVRGFRGNTPY